jgi:hypothetical protein
MLLAGSWGTCNAMGSTYRHIVRTILGAAGLIPVRFIGITAYVISALVVVITLTAALTRRSVRPAGGGLLYQGDG